MTGLLVCVAGYFALLLGIAWRTARHAGSDAFYSGGRNSPWPIVAFGMIGTSLSGVTFVSVPGTVGIEQFGYLQLVIGQALGYLVIAWALLPLYHRLGLTSIYGVLAQRLGPRSHRTGVAFFIAARTLGATARLYLVIVVLRWLLLDALGVPFWLTAAAILALILVVTIEGGVHTIVYTDLLQTAAMLLGLFVCTALLLQQLGLDPLAGWRAMRHAGLARLWVLEPRAPDYAVKQLLAGVFIAIAMTGMDQEMMQKSLSVRRLADAQKNMLLLGVVLLAVVAVFLYLGGLLTLVAPEVGVTARGDRLFPAIVQAALPPPVQLLFVVALVSALFPSADGALTALTSIACIDLLGLPQRADLDEAARKRMRRRVHLGFAALFMVLVLGFKALDDPSMIALVLKLAGYTYGPLLGLYAYAMLGRRRVADRWTPAVAVAAPLLCWIVDSQQARWLGGWHIGLELLPLDGALTYAGLWLLSRPAAPPSMKS